VLPFIPPQRLPTFPEVPCGSQVFPGGRECHEAFQGVYTAGDSVPLLRRPIVFGCAQGTVRPNNLGICLELQARPGGRVGRCWNIQEGGETDGLPWLVDVSCEVRDRLCRDILCLVQWFGVRHGVGPSGARDCPRTENKGGRPRVPRVGTCHILITGCLRNPCGMGSAGLICWRCVYGGLLVGHAL
jgi:hypothetical protein